ncbi:MAG TPA: 2-hydroxyacid dehydrogenase [Burkholderiaceae bacterium]|nr:2-hydroxyacid dehydrogenase [Burkholderiaceae bacterium]
MPADPFKLDHDRSPRARGVPDVAVFSAKSYDRQFLDAANREGICRLHYFEAALDAETVGLAAGREVACVFVNDLADAGILNSLAANGTRLLALRCTGFNNVDLAAARACGVRVVRVTTYSPYSVAEHTVALLMSLVRRIPRAWYRTRDGNFTLDGLLGFDLHGRTVAVIGTGRIGLAFARIMSGFGCTILGHDSHGNPAFEPLGGRYVGLDEALALADVVSLHCPLTPQTHHLVDARRLATCKPGLILLNTSRGALIDTAAVIDALKAQHLGGVAIDVYEQEADVFYRDWSSSIVADDMLERLLSFHNVIVTGHQAFFTREAMSTISRTTIDSIGQYVRGERLKDELDVG